MWNIITRRVSHTVVCVLQIRKYVSGAFNMTKPVRRKLVYDIIF